MKIRIAHLFPQQLNLYGDNGNIMSLVKRLEWRGIETETIGYSLENDIDFENIDILLLGGGADKEQLIACKRLIEIKYKLAEYINNNGVMLAVCGGFHMLGHYYKLNNDIVDGLGILDIYSETGSRLTGDVILKSPLFDMPVVGFENHMARTTINSHTSLGSVLYGSGNNGHDGTEGVIYKNLVATNLHGPILPKNPQLSDYILGRALARYGVNSLSPLDDTVEAAANNYIYNRFMQK